MIRRTQLQSWNRYAYVLNNPANFTDPLGLVCSGNSGLGDTPCNPANSGGGGGSGSFAGYGAFFLMFGNPTPQDVIVGWQLIGVDDGEIILGGCADFGGPDCFNNEVPIYDTVYSYPSFSLYQAIVVTPGAIGSADYISAISRALAPLNRLSDCTGKAIANQVPLGNKIFGTPKDPADPAGTALNTAKKLSSNKVPAKVVWGLDKAGLPMLSETVENSLTKVVSTLAPFAEKLNVAGWAWAGGKGVYDTAACYNKPNP